MLVNYHGNGPYCASDAITMMIGSASPGAAALEVLSGSPFGLSIQSTGMVDQDLPFFCAKEWLPPDGIANSLSLLGWTFDQNGGSREEAMAILRRATPEQPVLAGPVEMGLLPHHPGLGQPIGADHHLVVFGFDGDLILMHDPHGYPFATVPTEAFLTAWEADTVGYPVQPYTTRTNFRRLREIDLATALRQSVPTAIRLLDGPDSANSAERLAAMVESGLTRMQHKYLVEYQISGGTMRLSDAASLFARIGCTAAARIMEYQARLIGSLQLPLVTGDTATAAATFRALAPTYAQLRLALLQTAGLTYGLPD
ncbi:hypothetical protein [Amycolatopsis anabasis]|uniref:hypothetical protein n=1 Tax=Amycolatopsis anabasis TaxID=1840409 RepID=UPI00131BC6CE|nr:hypothetical protein [Amycolatopsis anabasis]